MKKIEYLDLTENLSSKTRRIEIGIAFINLSLALAIGSLALLKPLTHNQIILIICALLASIIMPVRLSFLKSSRYHNIRLKKKKKTLIKNIERAREFKHQHNAIGNRIATLLHYYQSEKTMAELKDFLNKETFSYVSHPFRFLVPSLKHKTTFADVIGDDVEKLRKIKITEWGEHADKICDEINLKIYKEENLIIKLIISKIGGEIELINSLKD